MARNPQAPTCRPVKGFGPRQPDRRFPGLARVWLLVAMLSVLPLSAAADEGRIEVRTAIAYLQDGVWFVDARVDFQLSDEANEALDSGVKLTFKLQIELSRVRRFWTNPEVANLTQSYQLQYHALSDRYLVTSLNSGEQDGFSTLFSALNNVGRIIALPVIDAALVDPDSRYEIAIMAVLDQERLPGPLRLVAFWRDGFSLESDWYTWTLRE
jgi:hypothetical protein